MFKKILAFFAAMSLVAAFAAVDVNKGSEAELDSIKGLGPAKSKLIVAERKKSEFKSWEDFISRVTGIGEKTAAKLSAEGLTVGGTSFKGAAAADTKAKKAEAAPAAKTDAKAEVKADAKADKAMAAKDAKPAPAAKDAKPEAKADAAKPAASAVKK